MTRYSVMLDEHWIAAAYADLPRLLLTDQEEDACSWSSHEEAVKAARRVSTLLDRPAWVHVRPNQKDCCPVEQGARQEALERRYEEDGRHDPEHPQYGLYTGLVAQGGAQ